MENPMKFLSEHQITEIVAEQFADEIREEAQALQAAARALGFRLNITTIADSFEIVTVQSIRELATT
jgi:hypothetical protein